MSGSYPNVLGESETLDRVLAGASLARYGDGELKMCDGASIKSQRHEPGLQRQLTHVLHNSGHCLVGIPNIRSDTPKAPFWGKFMAYSRLLADRPYVSAFVTRPDSAPWIDTPEYWAKLESLWVDHEVTLVRGSGKSLTADILLGAKAITEIMAPRQHAFAEYQHLVARIEAAGNKRVLLCMGPTATVMAVDLCAQGFHAIDLGHVGMFLKKHRRGEPMWVSPEDKTPELSR